eukprot:CAMPEP_0118931632 /NCGR_PEP_ID=MMETSP1169-20130426/7905_1 /TAXON_ID=36882 /ORGANISM="Pyramimonas obovata, Strain CCMP722" /LENGTH=127 /DNA_ID=CAMNT_0006874153 /DNA_START=335 /DNA_END=715 /DNA_ORIENTATION=-
MDDVHVQRFNDFLLTKCISGAFALECGGVHHYLHIQAVVRILAPNAAVVTRKIKQSRDGTGPASKPQHLRLPQRYGLPTRSALVLPAAGGGEEEPKDLDEAIRGLPALGSVAGEAQAVRKGLSLPVW